MPVSSVLVFYLPLSKESEVFSLLEGNAALPRKTHSALASQGTLEPALPSSHWHAQLTSLQVFICEWLDNCILTLLNNPATGAFAHHSVAVFPRERPQPLLC